MDLFIHSMNRSLLGTFVKCKAQSWFTVTYSLVVGGLREAGDALV